MTLRRIINRGKGKAGHWRVEQQNGYSRLFHYSTLMAVWKGHKIHYMTIGHGSMSDQGGMNIFFKELNVPYYYSRRGFPQIRLIDEPKCN